MKGDLEDFGVAELLQVLAMGRRSGRLSLDGDLEAGRIELRSGGPVDAATDSGRRGEQAFFRLMRNRTGRFTFDKMEEANPGAESTISRPLDALLIEASQQGE